MKLTLLLLQSLPAILQGVIAVEAALKNTGASGETKKQVLLNAIDQAAVSGEGVPEANVQAVSGLVDLTVKTLNQSGVFTHTPPPVITMSVGGPGVR